MKPGDTTKDGYRIIEPVGEPGGMGQVFKAAKDADIVALKVCTLDDEESKKRFRREVRLMKSITHHNVMHVLFDFLDDDLPYFVMPLCKSSLESIIHQTQGNYKQVVQIMLQVCQGVSALHSSNVIHRDIKPRNVLISHDNTLVVSDLGLGKFVNRDSTTLTAVNVSMGTAGYIPPEFFTLGGTKNATVESDVYQLGKMLYHLSSGNYPDYIEKSVVPGGLLYIIEKCTSIDKSNRYHSVGELEDALNSYLLSLDPKSNPQQWFETLLNQAILNLSNRNYDSKNIEQLVQSLYRVKEQPEIFFRLFHKQPKGVLQIIAGKFPDLSKPLVEIYEEVVEKYFRENKIDFYYADSVANSMQVIYLFEKNISVKTKCLRMILFAGSYCNRYHAMDVFQDILLTINENESVVATIEMLKDNKNYYEDLVDRIPEGKLHPLILHFHQEVKTTLNERKAAEKKEIEVWYKGLNLS